MVTGAAASSVSAGRRVTEDRGNRKERRTMKGRGIVVRLGALTALIAAGCGIQKHSLLLPNQPPEVELFAQRVDQSTTGPFTYRFDWAGRDPDGRIDHFLYSVGSPA